MQLEQISYILAIIICLFLIAQIIFYGLVFPIMVLSDLNKSLLSKPAKIVYSIFIVVTWTFGALTYGLFTSKKKDLKIMTWVFFLLLFVQAILFYFIYKDVSSKSFTFAP